MFERNYPLICTIIGTGLVFKFSGFVSKFDTLIPLLTQSSLTISATLLGFLLTILTIINTISTRRMQFVKESGGYPVLLSYLSKAIIANIAVVLFSFVELFLDRSKINCTVTMVADYCFIFVALFSIMLTTRFAIIFIQLLADKKQPV